MPVATPECTDPKAYAAIPDDALECIMTHRHHWPPWRQQKPKHVRFQYDSQTAAIETTEYYGTCELCKTTRKLWRGRYDNAFLWAEYKYPDGYLAPPGTKWDIDLIRDQPSGILELHQLLP